MRCGVCLLSKWYLWSQSEICPDIVLFLKLIIKPKHPTSTNAGQDGPFLWHEVCVFFVGVKWFVTWESKIKLFYCPPTPTKKRLFCFWCQNARMVYYSAACEKWFQYAVAVGQKNRSLSVLMFMSPLRWEGMQAQDLPVISWRATTARKLTWHTQ